MGERETLYDSIPGYKFTFYQAEETYSLLVSHLKVTNFQLPSLDAWRVGNLHLILWDGSNGRHTQYFQVTRRTTNHSVLICYLYKWCIVVSYHKQPVLLQITYCNSHSRNSRNIKMDKTIFHPRPVWDLHLSIHSTIISHSCVDKFILYLDITILNVAQENHEPPFCLRQLLTWTNMARSYLEHNITCSRDLVCHVHCSHFS